MTEPRCAWCDAELDWDGPTLSHEGFTAALTDGKIHIGGLLRVALFSTACCGRQIPEGTFRFEGPLEEVRAAIQPLFERPAFLRDWDPTDLSKPLPVPPVMPLLGQQEVAELLDTHGEDEGHRLLCEWRDDHVHVVDGQVAAAHISFAVVCSCGARLFEGRAVGERTSAPAPQGQGPSDSMWIVDVDDEPSPFPLIVTRKPLRTLKAPEGAEAPASEGDPALPPLRAHPAAAIFPRMTSAELQRLADDIGAKGLLHPVVVHNGLVLDGRSRLEACRMAGVKPVYVEWSGEGSPIDYVISANLMRRQVNTRQRAICAARSVPFFAAEARERMLRGKADPLANSPEGAAAAQGSRDRAAKQWGVASRMVGDVMRALSAGQPDVVTALETGRISPSRAAAIATLPGRQQLDALTAFLACRKKALKPPPQVSTEPGAAPRSEAANLSTLREVVTFALAVVRSTAGPSCTPAVEAFAMMLEQWLGTADQRGAAPSMRLTVEAGAPAGGLGTAASSGNGTPAVALPPIFDPSKFARPGLRQA